MICSVYIFALQTVKNTHSISVTMHLSHVSICYTFVCFKATFMTGIILEIAELHSNDIIIRGVIFISIGILLLIPSGKFNTVYYLFHDDALFLAILMNLYLTMFVCIYMYNTVTFL